MTPGTTVLLRLGDVVKVGGTEWIVTRVTDSCATVLPMAKSVRVIVPHADPSKAVTVSSNGRAMSICTTICHGEIERRLGQDGLNNFLGPASRHRRTNNKTNEAQEGKQDMKILRHPDQADARGGLAADAKQEKTNAEGTTSKGKLGTLFGHSVTSVLRRLGKEGVTTAHARAIMKAQKVKAADATVQIQLGRGRNKEGEVAALTKAQVDELVKSAPEPKEEPKAEPKAKGKGKGKGRKATAAVAA